MPKYKKGDVVWVNFPNDDPKNPGLKRRPGVILEQNQDTYYIIIGVTSTDWTGTYKGILVKHGTKVGNVMKIRGDSFINVEDIKEIPETLIHSLMGTCLLMDEIEKLIQAP